MALDQPITAERRGQFPWEVKPDWPQPTLATEVLFEAVPVEAKLWLLRVTVELCVGRVTSERCPGGPPDLNLNGQGRSQEFWVA